MAQIALLGSEGVKYCTKEKSSLDHDANWMQHLAVAQCITLPWFMLWRHFARFNDTKSKKEGQEHDQSSIDMESQLNIKLKKEAGKIDSAMQKVKEL